MPSSIQVLTLKVIQYMQLLTVLYFKCRILVGSLIIAPPPPLCSMWCTTPLFANRHRPGSSTHCPWKEPLSLIFDVKVLPRIVVFWLSFLSPAKTLPLLSMNNTSWSMKYYEYLSLHKMLSTLLIVAVNRTSDTYEPTVVNSLAHHESLCS